MLNELKVLKEFKATHKNANITPKKMLLVTKLLMDKYTGGRTVHEALRTLEFINHKSCKIVFALLKSAVANSQLTDKQVSLKEICVGRGLKSKRFMARARGRSARIEKQLSNITVVIKPINDTNTNNAAQEHNVMGEINNDK
jgi:large subunit ribosomal protein L22